MKTIELNEQQIEFLKGTLEEDLPENCEGECFDKTSALIARQIISKLEKE